jgi:hypothetical protein
MKVRDQKLADFERRRNDAGANKNEVRRSMLAQPFSFSSADSRHNRTATSAAAKAKRKIMSAETKAFIRLEANIPMSVPSNPPWSKDS